MRAYTIHYYLSSGGEGKEITFLAKNRFDAYDKAVYEIIPEMEKQPPYYAYVYSVKYQNGKQKIFNKDIFGR